MAVTFASGFEAQQAVTDNLSFGGGAAYSTAQARTGVASVRCNLGSGITGTIQPNTGGSTDWMHFGLYVASLPSVTRVIADSATATINLRLTSTGTLEVYNTSTLIGASSAAFATPGWHWVGFRHQTGTSVVFLQIDGVNAVTGTGTTVGGSGVVIGFGGTEASAVDAYFDDFILDDTGFLAPSKVDIALPISDNTVTGVTDNNGVTTNIWQCVDNTPPAGVASANEAANPKVGMHFPASTTCSYIANLETYTTLGVGSGDTVIAVLGLIRHGEDIATGTKNGDFIGIGNPTVGYSPTGFVFGNDGGAHGAEVGLWVTLFGNAGYTANPTVTLGSSPTIRVDRVSQSRVGCIDFMGLIVVWTPAAAAQVSHTNVMAPLLAQ